MRVRFWGTRGSIATPGPATNHFGGNTSCVELTTASGDLLIFDCGTGARALAADLMTRGKKTINANILLGHTHWDHIQGFPFFIHDAQDTPEEYGSKKTWGHSTYDYVVQIAAAAGVRRVALTHHDPTHDDRFVADIERKARALALQRGTGLDVFCAYEGCELVLEGGSTLKPFVAAAPFQPSVAQRRFHVLAVDDQPDMLTMVVRA